jgi:hypothetical protein
MSHAPLIPDPLHSLEALPGESTRPPLRLLERPLQVRSRATRRVAQRGPQGGWLDRLRRVLLLA